MPRRQRAADVELVPDPKQVLSCREQRDVSHVRKRKRRKSGTSVEFDADKLKTYVTGFRKRKQERREHAKRKIAEMEKKAKRIKRKEKEQELKKRCGMGKDDTWSASSDSEVEGQKETEVYSTSEYKTVVHIQPVTFGPVDRYDLQARQVHVHRLCLQVRRRAKKRGEEGIDDALSRLE